MNLPLSLQILLYGMPFDKSNLLNKKISRREYIIKQLLPIIGIIRISAIILLIIISIVLMLKLTGIPSCVESGTFYNHMEAII